MFGYVRTFTMRQSMIWPDLRFAITTSWPGATLADKRITAPCGNTITVQVSSAKTSTRSACPESDLTRRDPQTPMGTSSTPIGTATDSALASDADVSASCAGVCAGECKVGCVAGP